MKTSVTVQYDERAFTQIDNAIRASPALFKTATNLELRRIRPLIKKDLALKPRHSPGIRFRWSTDPRADARARGYWFATHVPRGSSGGVYQRTGETERQVDVMGTADRNNGEISIKLPERAGKFVFNQDNRQIPSHALSGHPQIQVVVAKWTPIVSDRLSEIWYSVSDPFGGVKR